jgi:hypothetical protein
MVLDNPHGQHCGLVGEVWIELDSRPGTHRLRRCRGDAGLRRPAEHEVDGFDGVACTPRIGDLRDRSGEASRGWKDHRTTTDVTTRTQAMTATAKDEEDPMKINLYVEDTVLPLVTGRRFRGR